MKHSVLFIIPQLSHGGSNRSLQSIFASFPDSDWAVYSLENGGEKTPYSSVFSSRLVEQGWLYKTCKGNVILRKTLNALQNYLNIDLWAFVYSNEARRLQKEMRCNTVVGFEESYATLFASYFKNVKKIAWMHCDYDLYKIYSGGRDEHRLYQRFDKIIAVSNFAKEGFVRHFPEAKDKTHVIYNLLDTCQIIKDAQYPIDDERFVSDCFTVVSIGRISEVKQFQKIPDYILQIKQIRPTIQLRWFVIGDGDSYLKDEIEKKTTEYSIRSELVLLGAKVNPYPYIKNSNLLVCTSRTESWSYVINEAKVLHTPVVTIRCGSSEEVVEHGITGYITKEQDLPALLVDMIEDKNGLYSCIRENIKGFSYDNYSIVENLKDCFFCMKLSDILLFREWKTNTMKPK